MPAHFYFSATTAFHPPIRQQQALELSIRKLQSIKLSQRSSSKQPSLLKTVLVYNMFKATMATDPMDMETEDKSNPAKDAAEAEAEAAEQSWFDNCIDTMITEEEDEDEDEEDMDMDLDEDEDLNMEGDARCVVFDPRNGPSPIDTKSSSNGNGNGSDDSGSSDNGHARPLLKRSCSANSIHNFHLPGHLSLVSQT